jgi:hypothetical protein
MPQDWRGKNDTKNPSVTALQYIGVFTHYTVGGRGVLVGNKVKKPSFDTKYAMING